MKILFIFDGTIERRAHAPFVSADLFINYIWKIFASMQSLNVFDQNHLQYICATRININIHVYHAIDQ